MTQMERKSRGDRVSSLLPDQERDAIAKLIAWPWPPHTPPPHPFSDVVPTQKDYDAADALLDLFARPDVEELARAIEERWASAGYDIEDEALADLAAEAACAAAGVVRRAEPGAAVPVTPPPDPPCDYCEHPRSLHEGPLHDSECNAEAKLWESPPTADDPRPAAIVGSCACNFFEGAAAGRVSSPPTPTREEVEKLIATVRSVFFGGSGYVSTLGEDAATADALIRAGFVAVSLGASPTTETETP